MVYIYRILFSHEKEGHPAIWNNMMDLEDIRLNESDRETNTMHHLYVEPIIKKPKLAQRVSKTVVSIGLGMGGL